MSANPSSRLPGIGSHQSARRITDTWLTPPHIIEALGPFDLDPCAAVEAPTWTGAAEIFTESDDGLAQPWSGRVWLNPPYTDVTPWLARMADHNRGTVLIFARCETEHWFRYVWPHATALLFLAGRLSFYRAPSTADAFDQMAQQSPSKAGHNSGGPSVLIAYGSDDAERLRTCGLAGAFVDSITVRSVGGNP